MIVVEIAPVHLHDVARAIKNGEDDRAVEVLVSAVSQDAQLLQPPAHLRPAERPGAPAQGARLYPGRTGREDGDLKDAGHRLRARQAAAQRGNHSALRHGAGSEHGRLAPAGGPRPLRKPSRKVLRRLERIEGLPQRQQVTLLRTIDTFLEAAALKSVRT